jgi:hypothetical protein
MKHEDECPDNTIIRSRQPPPKFIQFIIQQLSSLTLRLCATRVSQREMGESLTWEVQCNTRLLFGLHFKWHALYLCEVSLKSWSIPVWISIASLETTWKGRWLLLGMGKSYDDFHSGCRVAFNYQSGMSCYVHVVERLLMEHRRNRETQQVPLHYFIKRISGC